MMKLLKSPLILLLVIAAAIAIMVMLVRGKTELEHSPASYPAKTVDIITVKPLPLRTRAVGYGTVQPATTLTTRAELNGKIVYINPKLNQGDSLKTGDVALRIEPTTYEISLSQSESSLASTESGLQQLEVEEQSARRSLSLAQKNLAVGRQELKRIQSIFDKGLVARSQLDAEQQRVLQLEQTVQDLKGKLATYASRKNQSEAQIEQSKAQVSERKDTLGRTEIVLPFDARIGEVLVEEGEFVSAGNSLFEALSVDAIEIEAHIPVKMMRPLAAGMVQTNVESLIETAEVQSAIDAWNLEVNVRLVNDPSSQRWQGRLARIGEAVDSTRDSVSLVVTIDNPYEGIVPGKRPPLIKGMSTEVTFLTQPTEHLVIPRKAIHQGRVYVVDSDDQLQIKPVQIDFLQGNLAVLSSGLEIGDRLVVTDIVPVISGIPLKPRHAAQQEQTLAAAAAGVDTQP